MQNDLQPGLYRHFKGAWYRVLHVGSHTETQEKMVVYKGVNDDKVWIRPASMFTEQVAHDGKQVPRFVFHTR